MATFELPEMPDTRLSPQLLVGVASPLWGYFGAAAMGGVAYWWMTRWTQTANLEALFGKVSEAMTAPVAEAAAAVTEIAEAAAEALPEMPVGGESAPISPAVEALAPPEPVPEPVVEASSEPVVETPPEPMVEATADPLPEPVAKPRPPRKPPTANGLEA
jgi:outer membrane biosynthesis protein TonB